VRALLDLGHRADWDSAIAYFAPDAVWVTAQGTEDVEGAAAIRAFWAEWYEPYTDVRIETLDVIDLGGGVVKAVIGQSARFGNAPVRVGDHTALVYEFSDELIHRVTTFLDLDEAAAAARRLAEERRVQISEGQER
jgi:hypothetical protein